VLFAAATTLCYSEPWSLPNWLAEISNWIEHHLFGTRTISQVRTCPNGAVLKIDCSNGTFYLKTQLAPLAYEKQLLRLLNQRIPGACPIVLTPSPDDNSHVTEGISGSPIEEGWGAALRVAAQIQVQSIDFVCELDHAGVPHHDVNAIATRT